MISTRSATWTPPRPLPRIAPATRNAEEARRGPNAEREAPRTSPTAHDDRARRSTFASARGRPGAPAEAGDDGHDREQSRTRIAVVGQSHRPDRDDAHDHDDRIDRIAVEEAPEEEAQQPRDVAGVGEITGAAAGETRCRPASAASRRRRRGSRTNRKIGTANSANRTAVEQEAVGDRDVEEEDQQPDEDRAAVADPGADARQAASLAGSADDLERAS